MEGVQESVKKSGFKCFIFPSYIWVLATFEEPYGRNRLLITE